VKRDAIRIRGRIFLFAVFLFALFILHRLVTLQVIRVEEFRERATRQVQKYIEMDMPRAEIVDRHGSHLAVSVRCPSLFTFDPMKLKNQRRLAEQVSAISGAPVKQILARLEGRTSFTWIARKLPHTSMGAACEIEATHDGCELMEEPGRAYPHGTLAANLVGCMGTDGGLAGLEHQWNDLLSGGKKRFLVMRDAVSTRLIPLDLVADLDPKPERVRISIDAAIQYEAERLIQRAVDRYRAKLGVVVAMDPRTGDILAMAVRPTFDPNRPPSKLDRTWWNWAVCGAYEPGSTMKPITVAGALEGRRVSPRDAVFVGDGTMALGRKILRDDHPPLKTSYSVEEVVVHSSNVGAARIGMALGPESLYRCFRRFGFGDRTPLRMEGEREGTLREPSGWSSLSNAMLSFGQEVAVTPLQLAAAYCILANGGLRVPPRLLPDAPVPPPERVLSARTAQAMNRMLVAAVHEGTGKAASIPGVTVAGKTGTAQKLGVLDARDCPRHTAFFVGYAPAEAPRIVCLVMVDEPNGAYYGGKVAAPIFSELMGYALKRQRSRIPREPFQMVFKGEQS